MDFSQTFDLVYSHAVIDHVYDIDTFVSKMLSVCKKYLYLNSYRGYFPEIESHKSSWRDDAGCYFNDISVKQLKKILIKNGINENNFVIRPQENGNGITQTVIEVIK